jgi:peptidoglycan hydrolase CwlO-like protein
MSQSTISTIFNQTTSDRTGEALGPTWSSTKSSMKLVTTQGPFHFTGENSEIPSAIAALIDASNERLLISTQSFSDASIIQATEGALKRGVRVYMVIDSVGFDSMLNDPSCNALHGNVLLRERQERGLDIIIADWHLPNRIGFLLSTPLDGTLTRNTGGWAMELSKNQIDEFSTHIQHEFWSIKEGREVLSPEEVRNPKPIAEAPFTLRTIQNREYLLRSSLASDGDDSKAELALRNEKVWEGQIINESGQSSIIIQGEVLEVGTGASQVVHSSPRNTVPLSGQFAHSEISLQLAIGVESYLAGWDRTANGDWHSILRLTAEQAKAAKSLLQKFSESPEWIGHSKIKLGDAGNRIIRDGQEMEISDSQIQDLGVIHLDEMPDSSEVLQSHKPKLIPPKDNLARECEFKWISAPPVPSVSASKDGLHAEWNAARDMISKRLNALDELNIVSKMPGFGRKAKELQKSIEDSIEKLGTINDSKTFSDLVDKVEKLTTSVGGNLDAIKAAEDEETRQKLEDEQREVHKQAVDKAKASIKSLEPRLKKMNAELQKLEKSAKKAKDVEKKKLEGDVSQLTPKIKQLGSELKNATDLSNSKFEFKAPASLPPSKKKGTKTHKFLGDTRETKLSIKAPQEGLPQFGTLYKDGDIRYLAVSKWEHVEQGRKDAKRLKAGLCATREILQ